MSVKNKFRVSVRPILVWPTNLSHYLLLRAMSIQAIVIVTLHIFLSFLVVTNEDTAYTSI